MNNTAREIFDSAVRMLGYINNYGVSNEADISVRLIPVVNAVYADLHYAYYGSRRVFVPISSASDKLYLPKRLIDDCIVYGVCTHLATSENDGDNASLYANIYNQKRARSTHIEERKDCLAAVDD